jgi:hypothetical protein
LIAIQFAIVANKLNKLNSIILHRQIIFKNISRLNQRPITKLFCLLKNELTVGFSPEIFLLQQEQQI